MRLAFATAALLLAPAASASHLAMPESTLFHNGKIYVSLIGDPENNDGAIVTVDTTGRVTGTWFVTFNELAVGGAQVGG